VARVLRPIFDGVDREKFVVVLLDALCRHRHNAFWGYPFNRSRVVN